MLEDTFDLFKRTLCQFVIFKENHSRVETLKGLGARIFETKRVKLHRDIVMTFF